MNQEKKIVLNHKRTVILIELPFFSFALKMF